MADDQFEILVSTEDYLKLQSRCSDLELQTKTLKQCVSQLNSKILWINQQNSQQVKKIREYEDNIKYLSMQGIKMAQNIMQLTNNRTQMKQNQCIDNEVQTESVQKSSIYKKISIEEQKTMKAQIQKYKRRAQELQQKVRQLSEIQNKQLIHRQVQTLAIEQVCQKCEKIKLQFVESSKSTAENQKKILLQAQQANRKLHKQTQQHKNKCSQLQKRLQQISKQNQLLIKSKQTQITESKQNQSTIAIIKKQLQQTKQKLNKTKTQNTKLQLQFKKAVNQSTAIKKQMQAMSSKSVKNNQIFKELEEWKQYGAVKLKRLQQAEKHIVDYIDLVEGLNIQIKNMEKTNKEKSQLLTFYQQIQKDNVQEIAKLKSKLKNAVPQQGEKPLKEQANQMNFQKCLEQYFTTFTVKMLEGGASKHQIKNTLNLQQKKINEFIDGIIKQILQNFGLERCIKQVKSNPKLPKMISQ